MTRRGRTIAINDVTGLSASLAGISAAGPKRFSQTFGNGVLTSFTFTHNFNTLDVIVQVYPVAGGALIVPLSVTRTVNTITLTFLVAVATNGNRVVLLA